MLHGQLPLRLMISAIAVRTSSRTIATVHRFTPPIKYVYILIFWKLQVKIFRYFSPQQKNPGNLSVSRVSYVWTQCYLAITIYIILSVNQWLLDNGSNTTWSYSSTTLTISNRCIVVCKWWFFVWFVGKNLDFSLCPCSFRGFCYHNIITLLSYIPSLTILKILFFISDCST